MHKYAFSKLLPQEMKQHRKGLHRIYDIFILRPLIVFPLLGFVFKNAGARFPTCTSPRSGDQEHLSTAMPSWLQRIIYYLHWSKKYLIPLSRPRSAIDTDSTRTQFNVNDTAEDYDKRLLSELEELSKTCGRKYECHENTSTPSPAFGMSDEHEENFRKIWTRAKLKADRQLIKPKRRSHERHYFRFPDDLTSRSCSSSRPSFLLEDKELKFNSSSTGNEFQAAWPPSVPMLPEIAWKYFRSENNEITALKVWLYHLKEY